MADAETDHPDPQPTEALLFRRGDQIAVAVESEPAVGTRTEDADDRAPPREVRPPDRLIRQLTVRGRTQFGQGRAQFRGAVDELDPGIGPQRRECVAVCVVDENGGGVDSLISGGPCHQTVAAADVSRPIPSSCAVTCRVSAKNVETCLGSA
ncbi:hypothetical protein MMON_29380 [Mycolicibacterium monacense]|uniref:Uncharacterized protein n=1 Tax=Mycolicibacterium monacense TaxID=85693 RepID=A0AAD1IXT0_MYCMB|nr:hypothetical protein MMON_29380 [Mycolicibacterium monacense]